MERNAQAFDPTRIYVHLPNGGAAAPVENTPDFWQALMADTRSFDGRLLTAFHVSEDMPGWEMHPDGDEMSGTVNVLLDQADGTPTIRLRAGSACIVPKGVWHRFEVRVPGTLIFVTPGEGTQHRSL